MPNLARWSTTHRKYVLLGWVLLLERLLPRVNIEGTTAGIGPDTEQSPLLPGAAPARGRPATEGADL